MNKVFKYIILSVCFCALSVLGIVGCAGGVMAAERSEKEFGNGGYIGGDFGVVMTKKFLKEQKVSLFGSIAAIGGITFENQVELYNAYKVVTTEDPIFLEKLDAAAEFEASVLLEEGENTFLLHMDRSFLMDLWERLRAVLVDKYQMTAAGGELRFDEEGKFFEGYPVVELMESEWSYIVYSSAQDIDDGSDRLFGLLRYIVGEEVDIFEDRYSIKEYETNESLFTEQSFSDGFYKNGVFIRSLSHFGTVEQFGSGFEYPVKVFNKGWFFWEVGEKVYLCYITRHKTVRDVYIDFERYIGYVGLSKDVIEVRNLLARVNETSIITDINSTMNRLQGSFNGADKIGVVVYEDLQNVIEGWDINKEIPSESLIVFDYEGADGGNLEKTRKVIPGESVEGLPIPSKVGYEFGGWYSLPGGEGESYSTTLVIMPKGKLAMYAYWIGEKYTLTFHNNGKVSSIDVVYGSLVELPAPEPPSWWIYAEFKGWVYSRGIRFNMGYGTWIDPGSEGFKGVVLYNFKRDMDMYASWQYGIWESEGTDISYFGMFKQELMSGEVNWGQGGYYTQPDGKGEKITLGKVYPIVGVGDKSSQYYPYDNKITLYYYNTRSNLISLNFDYQGGVTGILKKDVMQGQILGVLPKPDRLGYSFDGWYDELGENYTDLTVPKIIGDIKLYAKWEANESTINLDYQGATSENTVQKVDVRYGEQGIVLPIPEKKDFIFRGWYTQPLGRGVRWSSSSIYQSLKDTMLYAYWEFNGTSRLVFNYQRSTGGDEVANKEVIYGQPVGKLPFPYRSGYVFGGWYTSTLGRGKEYVEATIYNFEGEITLYAYWISSAYKLLFDYQGGTIEIEVHVKDVTVGKEIGALPVPVKSGYEFAGWYTEKDGKGSIYESAQIYDRIEDTILYAYWAPIVISNVPDVEPEEEPRELVEVQNLDGDISGSTDGSIWETYENWTPVLKVEGSLGKRGIVIKVIDSAGGGVNSDKEFILIVYEGKTPISSRDISAISPVFMQIKPDTFYKLELWGSGVLLDSVGFTTSAGEPEVVEGLEVVEVINGLDSSTGSAGSTGGTGIVDSQVTEGDNYFKENYAIDSVVNNSSKGGGVKGVASGGYSEPSLSGIKDILEYSGDGQAVQNDSVDNSLVIPDNFIRKTSEDGTKVEDVPYINSMGVNTELERVSDIVDSQDDANLHNPDKDSDGVLKEEGTDAINTKLIWVVAGASILLVPFFLFIIFWRRRKEEEELEE